MLPTGVKVKVNYFYFQTIHKAFIVDQSIAVRMVAPEIPVRPLSNIRVQKAGNVFIARDKERTAKGRTPADAIASIREKSKPTVELID